MTKMPNDSQLLFYPMKDTTVSAGYKNLKYSKDPAHKFPHFGVDFDSLYPVDFNVLASGNGVVLGTEFNAGNSLGGIVVARYDSVYIPSIKSVKNLIVRHIHLSKVSVNKGTKLSRNIILGTVSGSHKWWNHLHVEIDTDTAHPFHTPQVSEASSQLLIRSGADGTTMIDPVGVLVIGQGQTAIVHPSAVYASSKDTPKYKEGDYSFGVETSPAPSQSAQKLILPINNMKVTAGYKNPKYQQRFGFKHFGLDMIGQSTVYASGNGTVVACGQDNILGNVVVVKYEKAVNHKSGKTLDIVMRYHHLACVKVKPNQKTNKDTVIGIMGNTGRYSTGIHLHIEVDSDTHEQFACWTPTLSGSSNIMKAGKDTTFNPAEILHCKVSAPDKQSINRLFDGYSSDADIDIPKIQ